MYVMITNEVPSILQSGCTTRSWQKGLDETDRGRQPAFLNENPSIKYKDNVEGPHREWSFAESDASVNGALLSPTGSLSKWRSMMQNHF